MHSFHTYLGNTYHVPCTRLAIKTTAVRETDPGNRSLEAYSLDSRGENTSKQLHERCKITEAKVHAMSKK